MKTKRSAFNLIELTLAIAVVGIGIASIMALFVPAIDSTKNSIADNYTPDVVNTFVSYLLASMKQDNATWGTYMNDSSNSLFQEKIFEDTSSAEDNPDLSGVAYDPIENWTEIDYFKGLYKTSKDGVFGVKTEGEEFTGYLCVWRKRLTDFYDPTNGNFPAVDKSQAIRVCFELSWPAGRPYESRERRLYTIDIFNNNYVSP